MHIRVKDGVVYMNMLDTVDTGEERGVGALVNHGMHGTCFLSMRGLAFTIEELNEIINTMRTYTGAGFNVLNR